MRPIGILREEKVPIDNRVPLSPNQCKTIIEEWGIPIHIQPSEHRCFTNGEYEDVGVVLKEDLSDCRMLIGVKEVPKERLIPNQIYFFFSHTIKAQPYNRDLLLAILDKNIRLIDWECLTNEKGERLIAFGRWAGIVGAHNALYMWAKRSGDFKLDRAVAINSFEKVKASYQNISFPPIRIALTGTGRVGQGCLEILRAAGIREVHPAEYLTGSFSEAVFVVLDSGDLNIRKTDGGYQQQEFFQNGELYETKFGAYAAKTDLMINGIYWDPKAPAFFTQDEMKQADFRIKAIADITCDIAPHSSIPSTLRPSTIENPIYGYDTQTGKETSAFIDSSVDVMAIDNLPNELPRDASEEFGTMFLKYILPEAIKPDRSTMLWNATIAIDGKLNHPFEYLSDFVNGK